MPAPETFLSTVADAYQHLYDLVRLRTHPLARLLVLDEAVSPKERAWRLHHVLLAAIEELDPGPQAPPYSREWCRYRLMRLRYVSGMDPPTVAQKIAVSRRQYYREHESAIRAVSELLWQRCAGVAKLGTGEDTRQPQPEPSLQDNYPPHTRSQLVRLEARHAAMAGSLDSLDDLVRGALSVLDPILRRRNITTCFEASFALQGIRAERAVLRQLLVAVAGFLCKHAHDAVLSLKPGCEPVPQLLLTVEPDTALDVAVVAEAQERLSTWNDLANLGGAQVAMLYQQRRFAGFRLEIPASHQRTVLVIDDNQDVLALLRGYLGLHGYRALTATATVDGIRVAREIRPDAVTLDARGRRLGCPAVAGEPPRDAGNPGHRM